MKHKIDHHLVINMLTAKHCTYTVYIEICSDVFHSCYAGYWKYNIGNHSKRLKKSSDIAVQNFIIS